ncbi:MAG: hypothetical protein WC584_03120 [Candidatus Pacearchaeota archaeon]
MKKIGNFLHHSNQENLKMNKKAFAESLIEKILWIVFFIGIMFAVYKLIKYLTGI